jgi:hypothetical protein
MLTGTSNFKQGGLIALSGIFIALKDNVKYKI